MKLRLGQSVHSTDGLFGEVGDIVIDPHERTVTHLVIEPHNQHQQSRLVPIWLVTVEDDIVHVSLSTAYIRQLQRVARSDFVGVGEKVTLGDEWDVGTEDVVAEPYWDAEKRLAGLIDKDTKRVSYDRIPKGECEIRRKSEVTTSDFNVVGTVEGFLADEGNLIAVVVKSGIPGRRRNVVVPMSSVERVMNDEILLSIDKRAFSSLPKTLAFVTEEPGGHDADTFTERVSSRASQVSERAKFFLNRRKG
jgi:sporulation protein YlmC with PRC-barrel domain